MSTSWRLSKFFENECFSFYNSYPRKRYDKAEREFIEAKLHLHNCGERKELLTDHLCAIIEQVKHRKTLNNIDQYNKSIIAAAKRIVGKYIIQVETSIN